MKQKPIKSTYYLPPDLHAFFEELVDAGTQPSITWIMLQAAKEWRERHYGEEKGK